MNIAADANLITYYARVDFPGFYDENETCSYALKQKATTSTGNMQRETWSDCQQNIRCHKVLWFLLWKFLIQHFVVREDCDFAITHHVVRQDCFLPTFIKMLEHGECFNLDDFDVIKSTISWNTGTNKREEVVLQLLGKSSPVTIYVLHLENSIERKWLPIRKIMSEVIRQSIRQSSSQQWRDQQLNRMLIDLLLWYFYCARFLPNEAFTRSPSSGIQSVWLIIHWIGLFIR